MRSYRKPLLVALSVLMLFAGFIPQAAAGNGNPVLDYLQSDIKPALDTVQRTTASTAQLLVSIDRNLLGLASQLGVFAGQLSALASQLSELSEQLGNLETQVGSIETAIGQMAKVTVHKGVIHTDPNGQFFANFVTGEGPKIRRYTVVLQFASLSGADVAAGVNKIEIFNGVAIDDITNFEMTAYTVDPSASPQEDGATFGPYAGTNSFIRVTRGNDGLGQRDVFYNAYVESLP